MDKALEVRVVEGFKIGRKEISVLHLQFADDTLFLLGADFDNVRNIKSNLKFFTFCSGLKINMGKSLWWE